MMATGGSMSPTATFSPPPTTATAMMTDSCGANMTNMSFISEEERERYLDHLQDQTTKSMIPALIWLTILGVTGLVGNSLVLFVYSQKFAQTATKILIITIASFDIFSNVVIIPANFHGLLHMWDFDNPPLCRLRRFTNAFMTLSSAMVLVAVAVVRYRKVCNPHGWQVTSKHAKFISVGVAGLGILCAIPYAVINGRETKKTPNPSICGYACDVDDSFVGTKWPLIVNGFFLILFFAMLIPMVVMYVKIGVTAWKHSRQHGVSDVIAGNAKTNDSERQAGKECPYRWQNTTPESSDTHGKLTESFEFSSQGSLNVMNEKNKQPNSQDKEDRLKIQSVRIVNDRVEVITPKVDELVGEIRAAMKEDKNSVETLVSDGDRGSNTVLGDDAVFQRASCEIDQVGHSMHEDTNDADMVTHKTDDEKSSPVPPPRPKRARALSRDNCEDTDLELNELTTDNSGLTAPSVQDENNQDRDINDQISALKWIDVFYSPEGGKYEITDPQTAGDGGLRPGSRFSVQLSSTHNILGKIENLKQFVLEALANEKTSSEPVNTDKDLTDIKEEEQQRNSTVGKQNGAFISSNDTAPLQEEKINMPEVDVEDKSKKSPVKKLKQIVAKAKPGNKLPQNNGGRKRSLGRTTKMLTIITAVFIIGFVPYLAAAFFAFAAPKKFENLNHVEVAFYYLFYESFLLNSAANPIVYSLCNVNFRRECVNLLKRCRRR